MKKYIFTESQIKKIIDNQVNESQQQINEDNIERNKIKAVQAFLNARLKTIPKFKQLEIDGKTGHNSATEEAIMMYQGMIGVYPTDGTWGPNTEAKMPPSEKQYLDKLVSKYESIIDNIATGLSNLF